MKKYTKFLISSLITAILICIIYCKNGLFPFGNNSIVQVDADFQFIPVLYHIYDFLHGNASIIYDNIGLGNNIFLQMIIQGSIFSPVNLLLYFTDRSNIVNYFNIILLVKLCLMSLTTYIYINKRHHNTPEFYKILFSIMYTFNGFILLNYFNIMWLDCVILFPLFMLFLEELLDNNKPIGYIIVLTSSLIISFYISYYILYFTLFYSFIYLYLNYSKKELKSRIALLGYATLIAILISSFVTVPAIYQMLISSRLFMSDSISLNSEFMIKALHVLISPLFIILFIKLILNFKKDQNKIYILCVILILFVVGIFLEPINLSIHGGSYWDFPYRYGFITSFILMLGSLHYLKISQSKTEIEKLKFFRIIIFLLAFVICIILNQSSEGLIAYNVITLEIKDINFSYLAIKIIILISIMYIISLSFSDKRYKYSLLSICSILSIMIFSSWTMYYNSGYYLCREANELNNQIDFPKDGRYKVDYTTYTPDYGFIFNVDTLDNWLHVIPSQESNVYQNLGYYIDGTRIRSNGGTIFSDYLLGFKYLLSESVKDYDMYELITSYKNKYLYKYRYNISNGFIINSNNDINFINSFDYQNKIYQNIFDTENNIINIENYTGEGDEIRVSLKIEDKGELYIKTDQYYDIDYISINDREVYISGDYIFNLGEFSDDIEIIIHKKTSDGIDLTFGFIEYQDILSLSSDVEYKDNKYYVNSLDKDDYLFLPINNISGMNVYVNNDKVQVEKYLDNFMMVKLNKGSNEIDVEYEMPLFKTGIILSIIGLILLFFWVKIDYKTYFKSICYIIYNVLVFILFIYYYVVSMVKWIMET